MLIWCLCQSANRMRRLENIIKKCVGVSVKRNVPVV